MPRLSYNDAAREVLPDLPVCFVGSSLKFIQTAQQAQWQACVAEASHMKMAKSFDIVDKRARVHCGSLQGAFFLHSEPDGPFFGDEVFSGKRTSLSQKGFDVDGASFSL